MPENNSVTKLEDLCLHNIAANITRYSHLFNNDKLSDRLHMCHRLLEIFGDKLLEKILHLHRQDIGKNTVNQELFKFLYLGSPTINVQYLKPILKLLFSKNVTSLYIQRGTARVIPEELLPVIFSELQNLQVISLGSCHILPEYLFDYVRKWTYLRELNLLYSTCSDLIIRSVLRRCLHLETLKASGLEITNQSLFCLCMDNYAEELGSFALSCRKRGRCDGPAKQLMSLTFFNTSIDKQGIMCLLLHCPSLQYLKVPCVDTFWQRTHCVVCEVIHELEEKYPDALPTPFDLQISNMCLSVNGMLAIRDAHLLPRVKSVCLHYSPFDMRNFEEIFPFHPGDLPQSRVRNLHTVNITAGDETIFLRSFMFFLWRCTNLKQLYIYSSKVFMDQNECHVEDKDIFPRGLERIGLIDIQCQTEWVSQFFSGLLSRSKNLVVLSISHALAEMELMAAVNENSFEHLEQILIFDADMQNISLQNLIHAHSKLKSILLGRCSYVESFIDVHRQAAKADCFDLDIGTFKTDQDAQYTLDSLYSLT